ncbi:MAG: methyltransferase regulatory domain-containing protein [Pseudolabrys sp.]|nr:methyltransferase regulatory domain-containing protein [Pseudolabrys sp.]
MDDAEKARAVAAAVPGARAFNREVAPAFIDHVCITSGFAPPPGSPVGEGVGANFTYCELHAGSAVTTALLAASNPFGEFHAIDPRPEMIASGKALAADGGTRNLTYHQGGIEAALEMPLPQFDYVVVHGIYSWVPMRERALVLAFLRKFLKPGGAVYVTYHARPGANRMEPFRRLFREVGRGMSLNPSQRLLATRDLYRLLFDAKAPAIAGSGFPPDALAQLSNLPPQAIQADYANEYVDPLFVTEIISDFAAIDCTLAGSAEMGETLPVLMGREPFKTILERLPTIAGRELAKDYLLDTAHRRDVFVRGGRRLAADNREAVLGGLAFALETPPAMVRYERRIPFGDMRFDNPYARAIVDALAAGPKTLGELIERGTAGGDPSDAVVSNVHALLLAQQIRPVYRGGREALQGAQAMAAAVRKRALSPEAVGFLPAPCGTAFAVPVPDQLFLNAGATDNADALVGAAITQLETAGQDPNRDELERRAKAFLRNRAYYEALRIA